MKVLYVLGRGRSGSTIFANVVGAHPGFFSGGEIRYLWDPVVVRYSSCGCGESIGTCSIWSRVLDDVSDINLDDVVEWQHEIVRERNLWRILRAGKGSWPALDRFGEVMGRLYASLARVTGAQVIVDSSKRPSYAAFLGRLPGVDPYFLHLVREPRASAYSWRSRQYDSSRGGHLVTQRSALDATLRWDLLNLGSEMILRASRHRALQMRYEDFVAEPRTNAEQVLSFLEESPAISPFEDERTVSLAPNHTIAGNPSRFATGRIVLEDKAEWKTSQRSVDRWITTAVALPLLRHYGYEVRI